MRTRPWQALAWVGPGFAVAATGIGAGDVVAAAVSGAQFGAAVAWAAVVGAVLKYGLNEGIARWQLASGSTVLEAWGRHLHRAVVLGFAVYLVLWTVVVAGALISACGLAAHAVFPQLSVAVWGVLHSLVALALVLIGRYALFERLVKIFIALMFATVITTAVLIGPDPAILAQALVLPAVPEGSVPLLLGVIGGVGGSVTLLSYSYWIRERGWTQPGDHRHARVDLAAAYLLTGLFGIAVIVIAAGVSVEAITGRQMALALAEEIGAATGPAGKWTFLAGFWGAVFTSMLGVWQGVPYIFADLVRVTGQRRGDFRETATVSTRSPHYRGYLIFTAIVPMALVFLDRPVWIIVAYSVAGALFMPFLAATLLYLNNHRQWLAGLRNGWLANALLIAALALFGYLGATDILERL